MTEPENLEKLRNRLRKGRYIEGSYRWPDGSVVPPWVFEATGYPLPEGQADAFYDANPGVFEKTPYAPLDWDRAPSDAKKPNAPSAPKGVNLLKGGGGTIGAHLEALRIKRRSSVEEQRRRRNWKGA